MRQTSLLVLLSTLGLAIATAPAAAEDFRRGWLELAVGPLDPGSTIDSGHELATALRGGLRLSERWSLEGSYSRIDDDTRYRDLDSDSLELSLRFSVLRGERWGLFVLAGPGYSQVDSRYSGFLVTDPQGFPVASSLREEGLTAHLGLGIDIDLSRRWYLRPEVRRRWIDHSPDGDQRQGTLAVGLRL